MQRGSRVGAREREKNEIVRSTPMILNHSHTDTLDLTAPVKVKAQGVDDRGGLRDGWLFVEKDLCTSDLCCASQRV